MRLISIILFASLAGCSSLQQTSSSVPTPNPGSALVFFYRSQDSSGAAVSVDIMDNGLELGTLPAGSYFSYNANPGIHEFALTTDTTALQRLKLEAGATYYIKADVSKDPLQFRPSLAVAFELQGKSDIQQLQRLRYYE
ncbi:MAG TPA: DUF2846 domain-containing protein [Chthoniobacterales bacterium]|nr:DUF2846 domain-containing protein [Chthoniobacterales bacterium]